MNTQTNYRGRARGHVGGNEKGKNRLWMSTCLTPGCGRAATLMLLSEMVAWNAQEPRFQHSQSMGRGLTLPGTSNNPCSLVPIRTKRKNPGLHPQEVDPPLRPPISWPKCLGRSFPAACLPVEPTPSSRSTSCDTDSSGPPSLESVTRPESRYEAFPSSSNTD